MLGFLGNHTGIIWQLITPGWVMSNIWLCERSLMKRFSVSLLYGRLDDEQGDWCINMDTPSNDNYDTSKQVFYAS